MAGPPLWRLAGKLDTPRLTKHGRCRPGDVLLCRDRRAEMHRLIRLAEGFAHKATATDRHIARTIHRAIDAASEVLVDRPYRPATLVVWLLRFRDAAERLERVARIGP